MNNLPDLATILNYDNVSVLNRFHHDNPDISEDEVRQIFKDLLSWLWLSEHRSQRHLKTHMIPPLARLDNLWHCFILHTQDYTDFCHHYFNRYLHHVVEPAGHEHTLSTEELSEYLENCYDLLGESWLLRNFPS
jgi:hypothetical protein